MRNKFRLAVNIWIIANFILAASFGIESGEGGMVLLALVFGFLFSWPVLIFLYWLFCALQAARPSCHYSWTIMILVTGLFCLIPLLLIEGMYDIRTSEFTPFAFISGYGGVICQLSPLHQLFKSFYEK